MYVLCFYIGLKYLSIYPLPFYFIMSLIIQKTIILVLRYFIHFLCGLWLCLFKELLYFGTTYIQSCYFPNNFVVLVFYV